MAEFKDRLYGLDVLRATAIILVVVYHWPRVESQHVFRIISHFGYLGVDLFFVLSGYLIVGQSFGLLVKNEFTLKGFYLRRLLRTLPNYYFILLISVWLEGISHFDWRYLFFLQNIGGLYNFTHSWSLCVEEYFYLFLPLIILFLNKKKWIKHIPFLISTILIIEIITRWCIWQQHRPDLIYQNDFNQGYEVYFKYIFYPTYNRLDGLAVGGFLAYLKHFNPEFWKKLMGQSQTLLIIAFIILFPTFYFIYKKTQLFNSVFGFTAISIGMAFVVVSSLSDKSLIQKIKIPGITTISILSYSIYLSHGFALDASRSLGNYFQLSPFGVTQIFIQIGFIFLFAAFLYWGLEKPILRQRDKLLATLKHKGLNE